MSYKVTASGNLVADPMLRFSQQGNAVCNFRIAISTGKDKPTAFKECVAFSYLAENLGASLLKGDRVIISGRIEVSEWQGKDGKDHRKETIIAEDCGPSLMYGEVECKRKTKEDYSGDNQAASSQYLNEEDLPF
jgi:single-strand DNA-binding protein